MINIGSVVKLKFGGPHMTVNAISEEDSNTVTCQWFIREKLAEASFNKKILNLVIEDADKLNAQCNEKQLPDWMKKDFKATHGD